MKVGDMDNIDWKSKFIQQNKDLGCEQMDPNGTIWDHAKKLQEENKRLREALENLCTAVLYQDGPSEDLRYQHSKAEKTLRGVIV